MILKLNWFGKKRSTVSKALVLSYHRVADLTVDPWQLAVSPYNFEQQLQFLKQNYKLISVNELAENLEKKTISANAICLTFDDGYSDNYFAAKPLLEKYECPAAFFIASQHVDRRQSFWWDELENVVLKSERLPQILSITINGEPFEFDLKNGNHLTSKQRKQHEAWLGYQKPVSERCKLFLALYERLICLSYSDLQFALQKLKHWAAFDKVAEESLPMTTKQLRDVADQPLFEVGLHTNTHTALSFQPKEIQLREITDNEQWLTDNCDKLTRALAYPNGRYNEATLAIVEQQKLIAAFTTNEQPITNLSERYRLGRFQIKNWNGKEFGRHLAKWMKKHDE